MRKNVIIRNLRIGNTYNGDLDGKTHDWDGVQADTASNIWIDHCIFERGADGLIDSRKDTNYLTVSNTIFRHHNKAFGIAWTDSVVAQITLHHSWFQNTTQRNPSADNIKYAHLYNNYLTNVTSYCHYAPGKTAMCTEIVYFKNTKDPVARDDTATLAASGNPYSGTSGTIAGNSGTVSKAMEYYKYMLDATANVPSMVQAEAGPKASIYPS
ncbi:uncharacterized protein N0V89_011522 [Didymosphaeria variabile]|uniref:Pectate lyase domain-containing protein n=1 Tax=Didymosphaeria variabile TaxID=1932322 RepID=A0A9W9C5E1_9PLEO|nr:uncharacterized protein N0V89_011522 [Didymosphaeria variabile]KAJ4345392.1 hypothetical protein N0V89_011522 [Didymosphaeria variabile]